MSRVPGSPPSSGVRVSAAVAPCTRDPRTRTDLPVDPRLQSTASFHQTAVVLPTQAKPSSTVTVPPDTAAQVEQAAGSSTGENIFDRLLKDLNPVKLESVTVPRVVDSGAYSAASGEQKTVGSSASAVESSVGKDQPLVHEETDAIRKLAASPRPAAGKPGDVYNDSENKSEEMQLKAVMALQQVSSHLQKPNRAETKHLDTGQSDIACDVNDAPSSPPDDDRGRDPRSQRRSGTKSGRRRASSQDRQKSKGSGGLAVDVRDKEKDAGPVAKRMRHEGHLNDSADSGPSDFM